MKRLMLRSAAPVALLALTAGTGLAETCGANTPDGVPGIDKAAGVIKLGTIVPLSGAPAVVGAGAAQGIDIAVREINAGGGIDGCQLEVVTLDNQYALDVTVSSARRLVDREQVWGLIAPLSSAYIPAIYATIEASGTPMWGPIAPPDEDKQTVYLVGTSRIEQTRVCLDYFAEQGITRVAAVTQDNPIGMQSEQGVRMQAEILGMEVVALEKVDNHAPNFTTALLNVAGAGPGGVITAFDPSQLPTALNGLREAGFTGLICSDSNSAGVGTMAIVGSADPAAADGFLGGLEMALITSDHPTVVAWREANESYQGQFASGAPGFSLQSYAYTLAFAEVLRRMDGDFSRENFHRVAEATGVDPIALGIMPDVKCGPLPGGHTCVRGAGLARLDAHTRTWTQIREFQPPRDE